MKIGKIQSLKFAVFVLATIAGVLSFSGGDVHAAAKTWTDTSGDHQFNTAANWSPLGVPSNGDSLVFNNTSGSSISVQNNISSLSVSGITMNGTKAIGIVTNNALTVTGDITSTNTDSANISGSITLGADVTVTNVGLYDATTKTLALGGHSLTLKTDSTYPTTTIAVAQDITGAGTFNVDVRSAVSLFLQPTNTYSGTTNIISGQVTTQGANSSNTLFGSSSIVVSPSGTLTLAAKGATWTFSNPISLEAAVVGNSGFLDSQLYIWADLPNSVINVPNITLNGDARFALNALSASGTVVNLAGIQANGHCIQYGDENNSNADEFQNGPEACSIGDDTVIPGVPNTGGSAGKNYFAGVVALVAIGIGSAFGLKYKFARR